MARGRSDGLESQPHVKFVELEASPDSEKRRKNHISPLFGNLRGGISSYDIQYIQVKLHSSRAPGQTFIAQQLISLHS